MSTTLVPSASPGSRRVLRLVLRTLKWLGIGALALITFIVIINLRDEELTPEARVLAQVHRSSVPDSQNAYLALVGFSAPLGADPITAGAKVVAEHDAAEIADPWGFERLPKLRQGLENQQDDHLKFVGDFSVGCSPFERACLPDPHAASINEALASNSELIARYLAFQRLPAYANVATPDMLGPMLLANGWSPARRLLLAQAAIDSGNGHAERAIAFIESDVGCWRRALSGDATLIDSMIAIRMLAEDYRVLSDLIALSKFDAESHEGTLRRIIVPLAQNERSLAHVFKREFETVAHTTMTLHTYPVPGEDNDWSTRVERWKMWLFHKPNATLNRKARLWAHLQDFSNAPPVDYASQRLKYESEVRNFSEIEITWVYNPVGKMLSAIGADGYTEYVGRATDLAAYVQLVRAQLELRLARMPADQATQFLANAPIYVRNPYNDKPFTWEPTKRVLSFEPVGERWRKWGPRATVPMAPSAPK